LALFEHCMVIFLNTIPLKVPELVMYACFDLIHLPHWVDSEWDSPSTELTRSDTPHQLSQCRVRLHVNWVNTEGTNIYEDFIIPQWHSWHGVSLCIDSVNMESHLALSQLMGNETPHQQSHRQMLKDKNMLANSWTKSKTLKSFIIGLQYICLISAKKQNKKLNASVPLR
jgi:hypothetical protein